MLCSLSSSSYASTCFKSCVVKCTHFSFICMLSLLYQYLNQSIAYAENLRHSSRLPAPAGEVKLLFRKVFCLHDNAERRRNAPGEREKAALLRRKQIFHKRVYSRAVSEKSGRVFPHFIPVYVSALLQLKKLVDRVVWSARRSGVAWAPAYVDIKQDSQLVYASFETWRHDEIRVTISCPIYRLPVA